MTLELDAETLRFAVVDEGETLCSTDALVAWLTDDHDGKWTKTRADLYQAVSEKCGCSKTTAERVIARAKKEKRVIDHGQRKPLEVADKAMTDSRKDSE